MRREAKSCATLLETLEAQLPDLKRGCDAFEAGARRISSERTMCRRVMANSGAIGDLLEVPKLMDACVRNGHYDEALDLENFVAKMEATHGDIGLVKKIADEARQSSAEMLRGLVGRLRVGIQLPECLRVVGYLRRLSAYDETTLRRTFLACREEYIANLVSDLDDGNAYEYLKRLTDVHRVSLFDVVMQYRAIFSDDAGPEANSNEVSGSLLYSWATHRISKYFGLIVATLPRVVEGAALASVYEHCEYCGTSLARVGLDTRPLLRPAFADAAANIFDSALASTGEEFQRALSASTWSHFAASSPSTTAVKQEGSDAVETPPESLAEHVPLAAFVNGVLLAYNELRHLVGALDVTTRLTRSLETALVRATSTLLASSRADGTEQRERAARAAVVAAYADIALPYLARAFSKLTDRVLTLEAVDDARNRLADARTV